MKTKINKMQITLTKRLTEATSWPGCLCDGKPLNVPPAPGKPPTALCCPKCGGNTMLWWV